MGTLAPVRALNNSVAYNFLIKNFLIDFLAANDYPIRATFSCHPIPIPFDSHSNYAISSRNP